MVLNRLAQGGGKRDEHDAKWARRSEGQKGVEGCRGRAGGDSQPGLHIHDAPVRKQHTGRTEPDRYPENSGADTNQHASQDANPEPCSIPLGLIAYQGADGNIYTIDPTGKQKTAITTDAQLNPGSGEVGQLYQYPTWAPNGQTLAFLGFTQDAVKGSQAGIFTATADGKKRVEAFSSKEAFPFYLFWSPNSEAITFLSNAAGGSDLALYLTPAAGGEAKILGTGQPYYWDWSPDNRSLITHSGGAASSNSSARIALLEVNSSAHDTELNLKPGMFQAPDWSPAGDDFVLLTENSSGGEELILAGKEGTVKTVLAQVSGQVSFAWSPKGDSLAYLSGLEGDSTGLQKRLVLIDPASPEGKKDVVQGIIVAFFWSPDGRKIAYFLIDPNNQGGVQNIVQTQSKIVVQIQVYDLDSGTSRQAAAFTPTNAFIQVFSFFDQYQRSGTIWSPDSQNIVYAGVDASGGPGIFVAGAEAGAAKKIAAGDAAFWSWK